MKTIKFIFIVLWVLGYVNTAYSQGGATCQNNVHVYNGPQTTQSLVYQLRTSTNPYISGLTGATKQSLSTYMDFRNGFPVGMLAGIDTCIQRIYADTTYCRELFEAIFGIKVIVCTAATLPTVTTISYSQFQIKIGTGSGGTGGVFEPASSLCTNCCEPPFNPIPQDQVCCQPCDNAPGCLDIIIEVAGNYYNVTQ